MLPGEKKESKLFFMCPKFIVIVLLEQKPPQIGKKRLGLFPHVLFLVLHLFL